MAVDSSTKNGSRGAVAAKGRSVDPNQGHLNPPGLGIKRADSPGGEPSFGAERDTVLKGGSLSPGKKSQE